MRTPIAAAPSCPCEAQRFFEALNWEDAPGELVVWTKKGNEKVSKWFESIVDATAYALASAKDSDVYYTVVTHGRTPKTKRGSNESAAALLSLWIDIDVREGVHKNRADLPPRAEAERMIAALPICPSAVVWSGGGFHVYWILREPFAIATPGDRVAATRISKGWQEFIRRKFAPYKVDATADLARVLRVPGTSNRKQGSDVRVELLTLSDERYNLDDFEPFLPAIAEILRKPGVVVEELIPRGQHHDGLRARAAKLARNGLDPATVAATLRVLIQQGILEGSEDPADPFTDADLQDLARSGVSKFGSPESDPRVVDADGHVDFDVDAPGDANEDWTEVAAGTRTVGEPRLDEAALHGIAGDFVRTVEPHSEASPAALLLQFLTLAGNAMGRTAHFIQEGDLHYTNLYVVVVGETSCGKGVSWGRVRQFAHGATGDWGKTNVKSGLSSGEGLIGAVRDPVYKIEDGENTCVDEGIQDKRLLVVETEFVAVLKVIKREGNTLSAHIRDAWDFGDMSTMTRSPVHATGVHLSIAAHITPGELLQHISEVGTSNGLGNRFLWVYVGPTKDLPRGGTLTDAALFPLRQRLAAALERGHNRGRIHFSREAEDLFVDVYRELKHQPPGVVGNICGRARPQVKRLALIYALLDDANAVTIEHMRAALAVWNYCRDSAHLIFGNSTGNPKADKILEEIRSRGANGMTKTEINNFLGGHTKKPELDAIIDLLIRTRLVRAEKVKSGGERYFAR